MNKWFITAVAATAMNCLSATMPPQAQSKGCLSCHAIETKIIGPSYKDVAKKYVGDKTAQDRLVKKIVNGGSGVWGTMPMPGGLVDEADARVLVKWILEIK